MKIAILGCHGSDLSAQDGSPNQDFRSVGFLINDVLLIDAGTVASRLTLTAQLGIRHVLLSHIHLDHIKELPALAVNVSAFSTTPIVVSSIAPVLDSLETHIFNDHVFPNFFHLPTPQRPVLKPHRLLPGQRTILPEAELEVIPILVNHLVPSVGYIISDGDSSIVFSGDTAPTEDIWKFARDTPQLRRAFIESSFPNELSEIADQTRHLTPALLEREFKKLGSPDLPLSVFHLKPQYRERITHQLSQLDIPHLDWLSEGQILHL